MTMRQYTLQNIELFRYVASLSVATFGIAAVHNNRLLIPSLYYMNLYAILDSFYTANDLLLHHLSVISLISSIKYLTPDDYKKSMIVHFLKVEYSTIFYSGGPIILHFLEKLRIRQTHSSERFEKIIQNSKTTILIAFAVTFMKYRIYDFSRNIIFNPDFYLPEHYLTRPAFVICVVTTYTLYCLNLYWVYLIIAKLFLKNV